MNRWQMSGQVGQFGWAFYRENQAEILNRSLSSYAVWRQNLLEYDWDPDAEIDPREWNPIVNQGNIGSCQGQSLADALDYCYTLGSHPGEIQLSRSWAYLYSQDMDGIRGDSGSTLNAGGKVAKQIGICLESSCPYEGSYSQMRTFFQSNKERLMQEASQFKLRTEVPLSNYDEIYHFLAARTGPVHIGILWGVPDAWEIKRYSYSGGGHAVLLVGYLKVNAWPKPGLILRNSWGTNWGRGGYGLLHPDVVEAMCRGKWNVFIGRSEMETPRPRPRPDW